LQADPGHALAWACLSRALALQAALGFAPVPEGNARAREAAQRALALEPSLAEAHLALGTVQTFYDWDWMSADATLRRALELSPGNAEALRAAGLLAYELGRLDESIALCRRAIEQDPLNAVGYTYLGRPCHAAGLLSDAEHAYRKALEISPNGIPFHFLFAIVLDAQGRREEALAEALRETADWARLCALAVLHHTAGRHAESDQALQELIEKGTGHSDFQIALAYAVRGEVDKAFEWLGRAYATRDSGMAMMKSLPLFRSLYADPRWGAFLKKMGLAD
jgi:tetratricopeptide (TPR) repeat protein